MQHRFHSLIGCGEVENWIRKWARSRAEGVGFEPTVGFPTLDFESSALNRTQPPFLDKNRTLSVQRPISNDRRKYDRQNPACEEASGSSSANSTAGLQVTTYLAGRGGYGRE